MALRKTNVEILLSKGIEQKVSDYVMPDDSLARAENVDFSKLGVAKKRAGFVPNSNLVLGAGTLDEVRRLGARQRRELLCVTETVTQIGSAAGVGNAGDTLFAYSEETERWIARGKMPRANVDVLWTSGAGAPIAQQNPTEYVTGGIGNYVCIAYLPTLASTPSPTRVVVFDVGGDVNGTLREAPTIVIDTTFVGGRLIGWAQAGGRVWLIHALANSTQARSFDPASMQFDTADTVVHATQSAFAVSTDGTDIFIAHRHTLTSYSIWKYNSSFVATAAVFDTAAPLAGGQEIAIDARTAYVDVARHDLSSGEVYVSRFVKSVLSTVLVSTLMAVGTSGSGTQFSNIEICTTAENEALVIWANQNTYNQTTQPTSCTVALVRMSTAAVLGAFQQSSIVPYAQPFIMDGRVYLICMHSTGYVRWSAATDSLTGTQLGEESFMLMQVPLDTLNADSAFMPSAQWDYGNCVAKTNFFGTSSGGTWWMHGRTVYQDGTSVYVTTNVAATSGKSGLEAQPAPRLIRLEMGDAAHRWRHDEFHDYAVFGGGVPFMYDGSRSFELATAIHCPTIIGAYVSGGAQLADGGYFFRAAMLYIDGNGRECWSPPSRIWGVTITSPNGNLDVVAMPVTTTMKVDIGNSTLGRMKLYLFMATSNAPNEYRVCADPVEIWPNGLNPISFSTVTVPPTTNDLMYTSGFELDNYPAPPCRALAVHSGRLFEIASDSNEVYYTKPFRRDRGPEFALEQTIPLPDKGTALASLNDRLAIFTHRSILAIGGDGPDVTGTPPDAFSRPVLVSPDYGCVEYCAVGRTPLGIIFRGQQGFYLLSMGFDVAYIGASVEDITSRWTATRSIVHDQKSACCRITGFTGERSEELCFWYDTKRWSLNLLAEDVVDSIALGENIVVGVADTSIAVASRYRLGTRGDVAYDDFGTPYAQTIETGWMSFQQAGVFKRIWRVYVLARAQSDSVVRVQVWRDWHEEPSSDREFTLSSLDTEPRNLRIHLKHQKLKAIKVRVTVTSDGAGADLMKIGFELGQRYGGPKEAREQTQ